MEVDRLRMQLEGWEDDETTRLTARDLALSAIEESLDEGRDVLVPQYLGRPDFVEALGGVARAMGARFVEVVLWDDDAAVIDRFTGRRAALLAAGSRHPELEVDDVGAAIAEASTRLRQLVVERPGTVELWAGDGPDALVEQLVELVRR